MRIRPETVADNPDALLRQYLRNRILWWNDQIGRLGDSNVRALESVLRDARNEVADRLSRDADGTLRLTDWSRERERELADWLDVALAGTADAVTGTLQGAAMAAVVASADAHNSIFSLDGRARAIATVGLSRAQLEAFLQAADVGDKVADAMGAARDEMISALRVNMVRGGGTAEGVRRAIRAAADAGFALARRHAITMTRTFTQAANTAAMEAVYRANSTLIRGVVRVATLDNGTCLACALADGAKYAFPAERRPTLPTHPRCRCVYVPEARSWKDFGVDNVRELDEVARPWVIRRDGNIDDGGRRIERTGRIQGTFQDWWKSLPPELRARTGIGKIRGQLLDSGAVSWDDLWDKGTGRVRSLKELGFGLDGGPLRDAGSLEGGGALYGSLKGGGGKLPVVKEGFYLGDISAGRPDEGFTLKNSTTDGIAWYGAHIAALLPDPVREPDDFIRKLVGALQTHTGAGGWSNALWGDNKEALDAARKASAIFPGSWVRKVDALYGAGQIVVLGVLGDGRAQFSEEDWAMYVRHEVSAVHEFSHVLQRKEIGVNKLFARLHGERTKGQPEEDLHSLTGKGYVGEKTMKDRYFNPYQGKVVNGKPVEVMPMAFEAMVKREYLCDMARHDKKMFCFTLGVLFGGRP